MARGHGCAHAGSAEDRVIRHLRVSWNWKSALVLLPVLAHSVEFLVHSWAGTPLLGWSMAGSILFSVATTRLHLIAMHRGVMTVGPGSQSLAADLRALPATLAAFFGIALRG